MFSQAVSPLKPLYGSDQEGVAEYYKDKKDHDPFSGRGRGDRSLMTDQCPSKQQHGKKDTDDTDDQTDHQKGLKKIKLHTTPPR